MEYISSFKYEESTIINDHHSSIDTRELLAMTKQTFTSGTTKYAYVYIWSETGHIQNGKRKRWNYLKYDVGKECRKKLKGKDKLKIFTIKFAKTWQNIISNTKT